MFFPKVKPRKFTITPYFYVKKNEEEESEGKHRIRFRRLRRKPAQGQKSIVRLAILAILILFFLYYFWGLVEQEKRTFKIEDVKIEEAPSN
jgi:cell division septal protein FtsQ